MAHPEPPVRPVQDQRDPDAPQRLVEERRVERRVLGEPGGPVHDVDLEPPRQRRRLTEQLLVEPVPPSPDRLAAMPGASASAARQWHAASARADQAPTPARCRQMPRPPCQIAAPPADRRLPEVHLPVVATRYSRAPTIRTARPRWRVADHTGFAAPCHPPAVASRSPARRGRIQNVARSGTGPRCQTDSAGLGIDAGTAR
jgi:hypothetical protein